MRARTLLANVWIVLCCAAVASAEEAGPSATDWLNHFSANWNEADWLPKQRGEGYMRPLADTGWQHRMRAFQGCVGWGEQAIPPLLEALRTGDAPRRIFAAQTLGYLGSAVPAEPLVVALKAEKDPAVRLYLVDALGMAGHGEALDWDAFLNTESNRDVQRHVGYVRERGSNPLDPSVVETLRQWDAATMHSAAVGQPAPDFALERAQGGRVRLADFRGESAVVLVFIYGDT
jgi:hypothetical protein